MSGSHRARCSSVPNSASGKQASVCTLTPSATVAQTVAQLLDHLQVDLVGLAAAAVLLGVGQAEQAGLARGCGTPRGGTGCRPRTAPAFGASSSRTSSRVEGQQLGGLLGGQVRSTACTGRASDAPRTTYSRSVMLSRSMPVGVGRTTTMSSMRAPCRPAR